MTDRIELDVDAIGKGTLKVNGTEIKAQGIVIRTHAGKATEIIITMPPKTVLANVEVDELKFLGWSRDEK